MIVVNRGITVPMDGLFEPLLSSNDIAGIDEQSNVDLCNLLVFQLGSLPVRYLGVTLISSKLSTDDCTALSNKKLSRVKALGQTNLCLMPADFRLTELSSLASRFTRACTLFCQKLFAIILNKLFFWTDTYTYIQVNLFGMPACRRKVV